MAFVIEKAATREPILSLGDWRRLAPPRMGDLHWQEGRSAMELARAWLGTASAPVVPAEVAALLDSHPATRGFVAERGWPEHVTRLDEFRGGQRNHDLVVVGQAGGVPTLLSVEGKADETFGPTIRERLAAARRQERSNLPTRLTSLSAAVLGVDLCSADAPADLLSLRYQLLHALVGTLIEARGQGCSQAVLVIHEFRTARTRPELREANARELGHFVEAVSGEPGGIVDGLLAGPYRVRGSAAVPGDVPFLIGKAVR
jgi:hypothetical protein